MTTAVSRRITSKIFQGLHTFFAFTLHGMWPWAYEQEEDIPLFYSLFGGFFFWFSLFFLFLGIPTFFFHAHLLKGF